MLWILRPSLASMSTIPYVKLRAGDRTVPPSFQVLPISKPLFSLKNCPPDGSREIFWLKNTFFAQDLTDCNKNCSYPVPPLLAP